MVEPQRSNSNTLLAFLASTHFIIHVYTQLLPVLLLPLRDELGVSLVQISLLASVPRLLNVVTYIPSGITADRYPALILTASFVVTALGALLIPISKDFNFILVGFALLSLGSTLYHPPSLKLASESDARRMSLAMGIHNAGASLGFAAGPLLVGALMPKLGWRTSFFIWVPLTLTMAGISFVYGTRRLRSSEAEPGAPLLEGGLKSILTLGFVTVVAMSVLVEGTFNVLFTFMPTYFTLERGMSYGLASVISGLGPLTGLVGSFAGGFSGDRFGRYRMGVVVLLAVSALMALFPYSTGLWTLAAAYAVYRCLQAAFMPLMNSMIAAHSSPERRSLSFSINFVAVNVFGAVVPTATSVLIERYGTTVIFPISIAALVPTMGLIVLLGKIRKT